MKKYLTLALAMPLLFACSSDDLMEKENLSNNAFEGIEKVDATFTMADDQPTTRMATEWKNENGDRWGFAWLTDANSPSVLALDGRAYQNHPLNVTSGAFKPETSIYVGKYFLYFPYDESTVDIGKIKFNSLMEQTVKEGMASGNNDSSAKTGWKAIAKYAINIGDKWTNVTTAGRAIEGKAGIWDKAGIEQNYELYAATFSNQTGLDLTYTKNNPTFGGRTISGATDITYTYPEGSDIGAAEIYDGVTVQLAGAHSSFEYAPTSEPNTGTTHDGAFWADKTGASGGKVENTDGFTFPLTAVPVTLNFEDRKISTGEADSKAWFWFNSLPVADASASTATQVTVVLPTTYGEVTVNKSLNECAYAFEPVGSNGNFLAYKEDGTGGTYKWIKLAGADALTDLNNLSWDVAAASHNTFVNQYGNHRGKYALTVDFSTGKMNGMHIEDDAHLQKVLKYYIASGKTENVSLNLDGKSAEDKTFKLSKISIALLQTINASTEKVKVHACTDASHNTPKIIITQDGQDVIGLDAMTEVPALNKVFDANTAVYLSKECNWTWSSADALPISNVTSITNEGTLTVNSTNVQLSYGGPSLKNAKGAIMNITKVTTVKNNLTNLGTINVGSEDNTAAELRAYGKLITNDATSLTEYGEINNYGVVGVTLGTSGEVNNYGKITMMSSAAITLLTSNQTGSANFDNKFNAASNKLGTVVLPEGDPYAIVSVSNLAETGFIKYNWTEATYTHDTGNVKYNTIVVSNDITFTGDAATEVQFIEFDGVRTKVVNPAASDKLTRLKGIIVNAGKSIIIEKTNKVNCSVDAYLGAGATVYNGGQFLKNGSDFTAGTVVNYLGEWSTDQVVVY